jgi:single-strand DNA-binding protein
MMQLNNIQLVGNLTREPELRKMPSGKAVVKISLAANETYTTADGEKKQDTTFVDVEVWGKSAENLAKLVDKGQEVLIQGALKQDKWQDKETGENRSKYFIRADSWQFTQHAPKRDAQEVAAER